MHNSLVELFDTFLSLEKENNLFDINIKGHPFWEYIRYYVFEEINRIKSGVVFPVKQRSYFQKFREFSQYLLYRLSLCRQPKKYDILLLTHIRTAKMDGKEVYFHIYPIAKALHKKFKLMVAHRHEFPIRKKDYPCPVILTRPLFLFASLKARFIKFSNEDKAHFIHLSRLINKTFETNIDILAIAQNHFARCLAIYDEFVRFFKTYKPAVIIYCESGEMKPILNAAHNAGIKGIDYQHGIVSPLSIIYSYSNSLDLENVRATNADYFFSFGDYWHQFLNTPAKPISVGFPYFDMCSKNKIVDSQRSKSILITSVLSARLELAQLAIDLAERLPDYTIYYRRRPEEHDALTSIYPVAFTQKPNIIHVTQKDGSLYDYLAKCNFLISTNSMTLFEGLASGLKTFVFKSGWYEEVEDLYKNGYAKLVTSASEIVSIIQNRENLFIPLPKNMLFKNDSVSHIESFFNDLLKHTHE